MKILQISDLHIGNGLNFIDEDENFEKIKNKVIEKWGDDEHKPIILVTGDITDSGTKRQYKKAKTILDKLKDKDFTIYFVPGNHDYGFKGNVASRKSFKKFKKYLFGIERVSYPFVKIQRNQNYNVAFIGLNSMKGECASWERFLADGELGDDQLEELEDILNDIEDLEEIEDQKYIKIVYLHHHPFILPEDQQKFYKLIAEKWAHALDDGEDLMNQISNNRIDALLFGHDHDHVDFSRAPTGERPLTKYYQIPCILSCGKSTKKSRGKFPAWLLEIDENGKIKAKNPQLA